MLCCRRVQSLRKKPAAFEAMQNILLNVCAFSRLRFGLFPFRIRKSVPIFGQNTISMKRHYTLAGTVIPAIAAAAICISCADLTRPEDGTAPTGGAPGTLEVLFNEKSIPATRGQEPDKDDFILTVTSSGGDKVYDGRFGDSPESIIVDPGNYTVSIISEEFKVPGFDCPQYGDTQIVVVQPGKKASVLLDCRQMNSGVRLDITDSFVNSFPDGELTLKSNSGSLDYNYGETRTAYFQPGSVSLVLNHGSVTETLFTRPLERQQILVVELNAGGTGTGTAGISVQVDTTRQWISERYYYGDRGSGDNGIGCAYSISEAKEHPGQTDVWVYGYIVGCFNTSGSPTFSGPYTKNTNMVIAGRAGTTDKDYCISVELKAGAIRDALNIVDNPGNVGRKIYLRGDLVDAYYGIVGMKQLTEYQWD